MNSKPMKTSLLPSKKKKIRETAINVMNETTRVCEKNGESLSTVLGECCSLTGKASHDAQKVFRSVRFLLPRRMVFE